MAAGFLRLGDLSAAHADTIECRAGFRSVRCESTADGAKRVMDSAPGAGLEYRLEKLCPPGSSCAREGCLVPEGPGTWYRIYTRPRGSGVSWDLRGQFCLPFSRAAEFGIVGTEDFWREIRKLSWPGARLRVQPTGGRTLVNLETNFFTTDTSGHRVHVQMFGSAVEVEVQPVSYRWRWADGSPVEETSTPGDRYPNLEVTHTYLRAGRVNPAVDVVYSGRFRMDGGAWHPFPETHVVPGDPVPLHVVEAQPGLVLPGG